MKAPTRKRPYLEDPNYYRIGYQLVAQILNQRLATGRAPDTDPLPVATDVLNSTRQMLAWYRSRPDKAARWQVWRHPLEPYEQRLKQFLERTVEPSMCLVVAALTDDKDEAADYVRRVADAAAHGDISYRARYALACSYARDQRSDRQAFEALEGALEDAPRDRDHELAEWSRRDPALAGLRSRDPARFDDVVEEFRSETPAPEKPLPDVVVELLRTGASDDFEVLLCAFEWPAWMNGHRPERDSPTDLMLRTVCAFLNTNGGTLLIGAVARSDNARYADDDLPPGAPVGTWALVGVDHELTEPWDRYAARLRAAIAEHIAPDAADRIKITEHTADQRTLAVITVERGDPDTDYYARRFGSADVFDQFWVREDRKNRPLSGPEIRPFKSKRKLPASQPDHAA